MSVLKLTLMRKLEKKQGNSIKELATLRVLGCFVLLVGVVPRRRLEMLTAKIGKEYYRFKRESWLSTIVWSIEHLLGGNRILDELGHLWYRAWTRTPIKCNHHECAFCQKKWRISNQTEPR